MTSEPNIRRAGITPDIRYQGVEAGPESENRVNMAFDILFEAVFRQEELERSVRPEMSTGAIDNYVQLGVHCTHEVSHKRRGGKVFSRSCSDSGALAQEW